MFNSTQNLIVIVNEFLDISRIEQGRMKYDMVDFDMNTLVTDIVTELKPMIDKAHLSADIILDKDNPCEVHADMGKIKQVVGNLIDNSIKYTPQGGITVSVSKENKKVKVQIKDTGIGIAEDDVSKLFAKFSRAKDAFRTNVIGTGLGLYVAKQMIEAQGGKVWVESGGLGKGSTFYIELPEKSV
jgi:signal transduction histidine kinase